MNFQPKREAIRKAVPAPIPVNSDPSNEVVVKVEKELPMFVHQSPLMINITPKQERSSLVAELDWDVTLEYDPLHPNDYDKITRGLHSY